MAMFDLILIHVFSLQLLMKQKIPVRNHAKKCCAVISLNVSSLKSTRLVYDSMKG